MLKAASQRLSGNDRYEGTAMKQCILTLTLLFLLPGIVLPTNIIIVKDYEYVFPWCGCMIIPVSSKNK